MSDSAPPYKNQGKRQVKRTSFELALAEAKTAYASLPSAAGTQKRRAEISQFLESVESELMMEASAVVRGLMTFAGVDIDPDGNIVPGTEPPEWATMGKRERQKAERMAKVGWMRTADVPHGVRMAQVILQGYIQANASREIAQAVLNIMPAQFPTPVIQVKEDGQSAADDLEVIEE